MHGEVISVDETTGDGLIAGDEGARYAFAASACRGRLSVGQKVEFSARDGVAAEVFKLSAARHRLGLAPPPELASTQALDTPLGPVANGGWGQLLWSADGRIGRTDFWKAWGVLLAAGLLLGWIPVVGTLVRFAILWPNVAIQTKRLHDIGRTGWLQLLPYAAWILIIPVSFLVMGVMTNDASASVFDLLAAAAVPFGLALLSNLAFFIWIGSVEGQAGSNRFGPDPRNPIEQTAETFA